jgi:hypothetical protein
MAEMRPTGIRHRFRRWRRTRNLAPRWVFWITVAVLLAVPVALAAAKVSR